MVLQRAAKRWLARDVACKADCRRTKAGRHLDCGAFRLIHHGVQDEMLFQGSLALSVNVPDGGPNLGVGIGLNILEQEIYESPVAAATPETQRHAGWFCGLGRLRLCQTE